MLNSGEKDFEIRLVKVIFDRDAFWHFGGDECGVDF